MKFCLYSWLPQALIFESQRFRRHQLDIILVIVIGAVVDYRSLHPHITICVSSVEPELGIRFKTTVGKKTLTSGNRFLLYPN